MGIRSINLYGTDRGQAVNLSSGELYDFDSSKSIRRVEVVAKWKTVGPN